ncbi:phosphoserine phosphatase SerB [Rhodobacteraceae bacterium]|nr:phosphoserine phosphatase SerB [Paracoccaceae bacterium]
MYTVILMTDPATPALNATTVDALRGAWGGGAVRWLHYGVAAEFPVETIADNRWQVWHDMQALGVDLVIVPSAGRAKKMLLADMDSTMIEQECIDELADVAGVGARVKDITARAMNGALDFEGALCERVSLLEGLGQDVIGQVIDSRITLMPGGPALIATMKREGAYCALVSGGFTAFTAHVAATLGFDEHRANTLLIENGKLTGKPAYPILGREAKMDAFHEISTRLELTPDQVMAVGDGANDLGMLGLAGAGVALHAKPSVAKQCDIRINHGDLSALLYVQGYHHDDFAIR